MSVNLVSTTDTPEQVQAALAGKAPPEVTVNESAADESQAETFETSEAQSKEEKPENGEPKKKSGIQKRVGKLAARATRAEERAFQAEKEAQHWREQAMKSSPPADVVTPKVEQEASGRPDVNKFDKHEEYVEALADWKVDQKLSQRDQKAKETEIKTSQAQREQAFFSDRAEFAKTKDDFDDVMSGIQGINTSLTVYESVLDAKKDGPQLLYELAKDPEEFKRICNLPAIQAAREIGKVEARLQTSAPQTETKTTKAPKPMKPVGSGSSGDLSTKDPGEMSPREYRAWRAKHPNG